MDEKLIDRKIKFNIDRFLKSRISPEIYFKYFYDDPPVEKEFDFNCVQLPKIKNKFS